MNILSMICMSTSEIIQRKYKLHKLIAENSLEEPKSSPIQRQTQDKAK